MFQWNIEDLLLYKGNHGVYLNNEKIYDCESKVSREDKIEFVDRFQDGKLSYLLSLIEKFENDKQTMPTDEFGNIKTVSLKAWIKRNDSKSTHGMKLLDDSYRYGSFQILGMQRYIQNNHKGMYDTYDDIVDELFHRQLKEKEREEKKYFLEHDPYSILKTKYRQHPAKTLFDFHIWDYSDGRLMIADEDEKFMRDITKEELENILSVFDKLIDYKNELEKEINISY